MPAGKPRKRDRLRKSFAEMAGLHTPTAASSATSAASRVAGLSETTTPSTSSTHLITPAEPPGGAIGNATSKSSLTSQPASTSATAAADTQLEDEGEQPISTAAGSIQAQSLWTRAINSDKLSPQESRTLKDFEVDSRETASAVKSKMDEILNKKKGEQWKVKFRGEEIVLRDVGMKILRWVDRFKQFGDIIVQYDPAHAALPWAGFRFLLQVDLNR